MRRDERAIALARGSLGILSLAVYALFFAIVALLALLAASSTSVLIIADEHTLYLADSVVGNVACVIVAALLVWLSRGLRQRFQARLETHATLFHVLRVVLLLMVAALCGFWVLSAKALPRADQRYVSEAALKSIEGDWTSFSDDGYMGTYKNQVGLFWVLRLFVWLSRARNVYVIGFAFQLFNIIGCTCAVKILSDLAGLFGGGKLDQLLVICAAMLFFPFLQYSTFVYGTVWGFAFSAVAVKREVLFFRHHRWRDLLIACVSISLGMLFKSNYVVFFIGMVMYACFVLLRGKVAQAIVTVAALAICYVAQAEAPLAAVRWQSGYRLDQGCSAWSWIAMGMQDGSFARGWYNGYNRRTYEEAGYRTDRQAEVARESIDESLAHFAEHPRQALRFYVQKTASQWNNPTFQGLWIAQMTSAAGEVEPPARELVSLSGSERATRLLDVIQTIVLAGTLAWCCLAPWRGEKACEPLILPIVFIGGFLCHLLWEAKCQYTVPYFELLLPLAVLGWTRLGDALHELTDGSPQDLAVKLATIRGRQQACAICVVVCLVASVLFFAGGIVADVRGDEAAWAQYLASGSGVPLLE